MEISNLSDAEFKTLVIRMLRELSENFNSIKKGMKVIEKNQSQVKDTLVKTKNILQRVNSRVDEAENQISILEYKKASNT